MTPLQIRMILYYYAIAEPYADGNTRHAKSSAVSDQRDELIRMGLLQACPESPAGYRTTERGSAYVDALCKMPLPVQKWVMPDAA